VCIHALSSMLTLLAPFLKGVPARALGLVRTRTGCVSRSRARGVGVVLSRFEG